MMVVGADEPEAGDGGGGDQTSGAVDDADLRAEVESALDTLREALDSSRQLSMMIAELEEKLAELKTQPADPARDEPGAVEQAVSDEDVP